MARSTSPIADKPPAEGHSRKRGPAPDVAVRKAAPPSHQSAAADGEVRIGPVAAIPELLRKFGVPPSASFVRAGVPLHTFKNPENLIAFEALGRLLSECSTATGCAHFGLLVGECFELEGLGDIGRLMRNSATDAEVSGIVFAASWLDQAIPGADPRLRALVISAIQQARASSTMGFADVVRGALHQMVLSGTSSAGNVALLFGIHERTLRKRLTAEATSLHSLVSQTRFELAKQLLENTELPLSEIASALHFADAAVFSRAFRSWSNTNPRHWRSRRECKTLAT
jgi:AraC-like DNA-binding protein